MNNLIKFMGFYTNILNNIIELEFNNKPKNIDKSKKYQFKIKKINNKYEPIFVNDLELTIGTLINCYFFTNLLMCKESCIKKIPDGWLNKYQNDNIKLSSTLFNNGKVIEKHFFTNNKLKIINKPNIKITYHENGNKASEIEQENWKYHGKMILYYQKPENIIRSIYTYNQGVLDGEYFLFNNCGVIKEKGMYTKGSRTETKKNFKCFKYEKGKIIIKTYDLVIFNDTQFEKFQIESKQVYDDNYNIQLRYYGKLNKNNVLVDYKVFKYKNNKVTEIRQTTNEGLQIINKFNNNKLNEVLEYHPDGLFLKNIFYESGEKEEYSEFNNKSLINYFDEDKKRIYKINETLNKYEVYFYDTNSLNKFINRINFKFNKLLEVYLQNKILFTANYSDGLICGHYDGVFFKNFFRINYKDFPLKNEIENSKILVTAKDGNIHGYMTILKTGKDKWSTFNTKIVASFKNNKLNGVLDYFKDGNIIKSKYYNNNKETTFFKMMFT